MDGIIVLLIAIGFVLIVLAVRNFRPLAAAQSEIAALERKLASYSGTERLYDTDIFDVSDSSDKSALTTSLRAHLRSMKRAATAKALSTFGVDAGLKAFSAASTSGVSQVRAISGIVLIVGLLITLANLQGAVGSLDRVLQESRGAHEHGNVKSLDPEALQTGMQGIAASATHAFRYSAIAIFTAAVLLGIATLQTSRAHNLNRGIASATSEIVAIAVAEEAKQSSEATLRDLSDAVSQFAEMTRVFEKTNTGLEELASFGSKFEASADLIGKAVDSLPKQIQTGMVNLSADVARGISEDLKHQLEYLKRIAAIYGDQQINIAAIQQYMDRTSEQIKTSAAAISKLEGTPGAIQSLAAAVSQFSTSTTSLETDVRSLNGKIDGFSIEAAVLELKQISSKLPLILDTKQSEYSERLQNILNKLNADLSSELAKKSNEISSTIVREIQAVQQMLRPNSSNGRGELSDPAYIQKQLAHIVTELNRVPKWRL